MKHGPTRTIFAAIAIACCVHRFTVQSYRAWPASKSFAGNTNSPSSNHLSSFTTRSSLRLAPGVDYLDDTTQIGAGARSSLNIDVDYLGMINFCLRSSDNGLSGPSINKLMNEITNDAFRALMIGYDPAIEITLLGFSTFTQQIQSMSDPQAAMTYLSWIEKLLINGEIVTDFSVTSNGSSSPIDSEYQKGYSRLLSLLKDAGCKVYESGLGRPKPQDSNICLSLLDLSRAEGVKSRTLELNTISNCVSKAMLYGTQKDKNYLAYSLETLAPEFSVRWKVPLDGQESLYIRSLAVLLRSGLSVASEAITYMFPLPAKQGVNGSAVDVGPMDLSLDIPPLRLHDTYQNAFQRVIESCLSEIGSRGGSVPQSGNDEILLTFVLWEQNLRRNLTGPLWKPNPSELTGTWELVDIAGQGSLSPIMTAGDSAFDADVSQEVLVELLSEGTVVVNQEKTSCTGQKWYFKPGPAHLDTCEFLIESSVDPDLVLRYTGFIDRGQRIESRFSRQPIRMTGRVVSTLKGEVQGSSRFVMVKKRDRDRKESIK